MESKTQRFYNCSEAALYVGLSLSNFTRQHRALNRLQPAVYVGNCPGFTREQLDDFKPKVRRRGRPKKQTSA